MTDILWLIFEFFKAGLFAVGGGLATLPYLTRMSQAHPTWFTTEMLANMVAISESTPGPLGINMATYVGYTVAGIPGGVVATLALVTPAVIIIMLIYRVLQQYKTNPLVVSGFGALRPAVTGLIAAAGYSVFRMAVLTGDPGSLFTLISWKALALCAALFALTQIKKTKNLHPVLFIAAGAVVGLLVEL